MKTLIIIAVLLISSNAHATYPMWPTDYPGVWVTMDTSKPECVTEFKTELYLHRSDIGYAYDVIKFYGDSAIINDKRQSATYWGWGWAGKQSDFYTHNSYSYASAFRSNLINDIKNTIDYRMSCVKFHSFAAPTFNSMSPVSDGIAASTSIIQAEIAHAPATATQTVAIIDTQIPGNYDYAYSDKVLPAISVTPLPAYDSNLSTNHAAMMVGATASIGNIKVLPIVAQNVANSISYREDYIVAGIKAARDAKVNVINMSWSNDAAIQPPTYKEIVTSIASGITVVKAMGNWGGFNQDDYYIKDMITVGAMVNDELVSTYSNHGPTVVMPMDGSCKIPLSFDTSSVNTDCASLKSSGATAYVSAQVAMLPKELTPHQKYEAICNTAIPLKILPTNTTDAAKNAKNNKINTKNAFVKCGIIDIKAAIDYAKATYKIWAIVASQPIFNPASGATKKYTAWRQSCSAKGGNFLKADQWTEYCYKGAWSDQIMILADIYKNILRNPNMLDASEENNDFSGLPQ